MFDREVLTTFSAKDGLTSVLNQIKSSASSAMSSFGAMKNMVLAGAAGIGLGAIVNGIIEVGAQAEQTSLVLGGMLTAFGYAGDLTSGMQQASGVMESIERAAAALPGEAQEYVEVFQAGFSLMQTRLIPQMNDSLLAGMREMTGEQLPTALDQMAGFSNQMTAIGRTFQIDAGQIGRDMNLMLSGRAGVGSRTFSALLPYMQQVEGQAGLTAISFNHLTDAQRVDVLVKGMAKLRPMLQGAATTWDAITGSIKTTVNQTIRGATLPIFNEIKSVAQEVSTALDHWKPTIVSLGAMISQHLVGAFHSVRRTVDRMMASNGFMTLERIAGQGRDMVMRIVQNGDQQRGAGVAASAIYSGPMGAFLGAAITAFVSNTQLVETSLLALANITDTLTGFVEPVLTLFGDLGLYLGTMVANIIPGLTWGLAMVVEGARYLATPLLEIGHEIMTAVGPQLTALGTAMGSLFQSIGSIIRPALQSFGEGLREMWSLAREYVVPAIRTFAEVLQFVIEKLAGFLSRLGGSFQGRIQGMITPLHNTAVRTASEAAADAATRATQAAAQAAARAPAAPAARGGHHTHNDFRFSRFDITQKFAEGFDPDRLAVAFVNDIQQMANAPLRSGFDPLFSV